MVNVTGAAVELEPTNTVPKERLDVDKVTGEPPVPVRFTVCGLFSASSVMLSAAVRVPLALGVKETLIVQFPPAETLLPQVLVWLKSPLFVPVKPMLLIVRAELRLFVKVTICGELVVPTTCEAKVRLVGETETPPQPGRVKLARRVCQLICVPVSFAGKYSFTYQKVQPLTGSTVMLL